MTHLQRTQLRLFQGIVSSCITQLPATSPLIFATNIRGCISCPAVSHQSHPRTPRRPISACVFGLERFTSPPKSCLFQDWAHTWARVPLCRMQSPSCCSPARKKSLSAPHATSGAVAASDNDDSLLSAETSSHSNDCFGFICQCWSVCQTQDLQRPAGLFAPGQS